MIIHWTKEEEELLLKLKSNKVPLKDIAVKLGRSLEAVRTRSKRLNQQLNLPTAGRLKWTEEEIALLREDYDYNELEELLPQYTRRAIMSQCEKLGISKRYHIVSQGTRSPTKKSILYLVDFGKYKKVGITQVGIKERLKQDGHYTVLDWVELDDDLACEFESAILKNMRKFKVKGSVRRGFNECFNYDCTLLEDLL